MLDEADIFLQKRDKADIKRNAIVSVFLRTLEYYSVSTLCSLRIVTLTVGFAGHSVSDDKPRWPI